MQVTRPDLATIAAQLHSPVTRFAPSPTGYLHLGHVVNAIYVWAVARALGGRVLLRIEDHDRIRSRPEFEAAILEDLDWLGFQANEGRNPVVRQSDRVVRYARALDLLRTTQHVYTCDCSRKDIGGERYDGRCRERALHEAPGRGLRVRIKDRAEHFEDLMLGPMTQVPAEQCGDILLRDRDGHWTYQFAATVDDIEQGVDLVIRGADLVSSTGRQIALARMLGRATPPRFLHHPLIVKPGGDKLSKASGDTGVRELRADGATPADVIGRAAAAVGLIDRIRPVAATEVATLFV
jgi:glutamyl-tRNA synthetase/glutamyl-Q tRNA(Asp) synthetase